MRELVDVGHVLVGRRTVVWHEMDASVGVASVTFPVHEGGRLVLAFMRDILCGDTEKERVQCASLFHVIGDVPESVGRDA